MIEKQIEQLELKDIEDLIANSVEEGKTLDYKKEYSIEKDPEKGEFLADICSFLNTTGGFLIFGIEEEKGVARKICPLSIEDADKEKLKIESIVKDGLSPRASIQIRFLKVKEDGHVLIIKIEKSWKGPHRVIFNAYSKTKDQFYSRNSAGKYQMDVEELRNSFLFSETVIEKIKNFRLGRIIDIEQNNTPIPLYKEGKICLHIIPVDSFSSGLNINLNESVLNSGEKTRPMYTSGWSRRVNLNGVLVYSGRSDDKYNSYTQIYRNGIIESVDSRILFSRNGEKSIPSGVYEKEIYHAIKRYLSFLKENNINTPLLIFISLIGIKNYKMAVSHRYFYSEDYNKIDTDVINLPEFLVQNYTDEISPSLKPIFDIVWNACGFKESDNFDNEGHWIGGTEH